MKTLAVERLLDRGTRQSSVNSKVRGRRVLGSCAAERAQRCPDRRAPAPPFWDSCYAGEQKGNKSPRQTRGSPRVAEGRQGSKVINARKAGGAAVPVRTKTRPRREHPMDQMRSIMMAGAIPPAAHMVTNPNCWSRRSSSSSTVPISIDPVAPIG